MSNKFNLLLLFFSDLCQIMVTFIYYVIKYHLLYAFVCMGARAAKGEGLKILWHRPSRVRIPSHALFYNFI